jgi:hypothetical protein
MSITKATNVPPNGMKNQKGIWIQQAGGLPGPYAVILYKRAFWQAAEKERNVERNGLSKATL